MSQPFLTRFLAGQRAKGQDQTPLFDMLTGLQAKTADDVLVSPQPTEAAPAWLKDALHHLGRKPTALKPTRLSRSQYQQGVPSAVRLVVSGEAAVHSLTACLDAAPCRQSARLIFRALYAVALDVACAQGHAANVSRSVFHLPAELLMNHVGLKKSAFYDNLQYLLKLGVVACEAHMGDLRGKSVATGTLWVVSLTPERVLSKQAAPVRILHDDWSHKWRDLNADVKAGRTVYNVLYPVSKTDAGQSRNPSTEKTSLEQLKAWAKNPIFSKETDTLTVRQAPGCALEVVWALGDASQQPRNRRAEIVDRQARTLAAAFGDSELGFWRRLIWNLTRGIEAGVNLADDAGRGSEPASWVTCSTINSAAKRRRAARQRWRMRRWKPCGSICGCSSISG